jgi:hypothetical protein
MFDCFMYKRILTAQIRAFVISSAGHKEDSFGSYTIFLPVFAMLSPRLAKSWYSSVSVATRVRLDERGIAVRYSAYVKIFLYLYVQTGSGVHAASAQWVQRAPSLGVKRPLRETDHSPPSGATVKNTRTCNYISTFPYFFMMWCLIKLRDNLTF